MNQSYFLLPIPFFFTWPSEPCTLLPVPDPRLSPLASHFSLPPIFPDGLILIDKPAGITSHDVVDRIRRILCPTKINRKNRSQFRTGHAGTLDPFATGLLIVGIKKGTKILTGLVGLDKTYEAEAILGATSTTDDIDGTIQMRDVRGEKRETIEQALNRFRGGYRQTAPAFSAKKINGKKLYELARKGKMEGIELPQKDIVISELTILSYEWPKLRLRVSCSSGTYIRSLARDIGETLGCGAYLSALRRTRIGMYTVDHATSLETLDSDTLAKNIFDPSILV